MEKDLLEEIVEEAKQITEEEIKICEPNVEVSKSDICLGVVSNNIRRYFALSFKCKKRANELFDSIILEIILENNKNGIFFFDPLEAVKHFDSYTSDTKNEFLNLKYKIMVIQHIAVLNLYLELKNLDLDKILKVHKDWKVATYKKPLKNESCYDTIFNDFIIKKPEVYN